MKHRICMLNIARINYDHRLDISCIKGDVVAYEDSDLQEILQRVQGCEIVVSKELGLSKALIEQFPDSVRLICEAGTGYNNIDLEPAAKRDHCVQYARLFHKACGTYGDYAAFKP